MGYLQHLVEAQKASRYTIIGELPSMSRPMYETLHTGVTSSVHGITNNAINRKSSMPNVFDLAMRQGKTTAAAAYYWYSELYNNTPFDPIRDREVDDESLAIQHGRFYMSDPYPDVDLFGQAGVLLAKFQPDYLLIHSMGMDYIGEKHGGSSAEYHHQAILQDSIIAYLLPFSLAMGYTVLVTADHGISDGGYHGGTLDERRRVPLYVIRPDEQGIGDTGEVHTQLRIAPTVCKLLGLPIPETMRHPPLQV
jgi:predicted AlkP superfamily pyrophosphatase or phosphodiesterase